MFWNNSEQLYENEIKLLRHRITDCEKHIDINKELLNKLIS